MVYNRNIIRQREKNIMKKIILYIILGVILAAGLGVGIYFLTKSDDQVSANAQTYVSVSINPAVEFTVNDDGLVASAVATDAEGDEIIQSFDFTGMSIDNACEKFTQLCIDAGYVAYDNDETSVEPNDVVITIVSEDEEVEQDLASKIKLKLNNCFQNNGIFGYVTTDALSEYAEQAAEYGISVGHVKLIMSALYYNPELTFEELAVLPINEVVKLVKTSHNNMAQTTNAIRTQLKTQLEALKTNEDYVDMFTALEAIHQIQISLNDNALTAEQLAQLETDLTQAKANFSETYGELFVQYKNAKEALIEQAKKTLRVL